MILTKPQQKFLRSLGHDLKPVVMLGQHGMSENVMKEVEIALLRHELIKIKLAVGDRDLRDQLIEQIVSESHASVIQKVGNMLLIFRRNPQNPVISLAKVR